jgi:hypothetical protein
LDEIENENRSTDLPQDERRRSEVSFPLDAFVRSVGVNTGAGHILLLGAGCSITSKVPSAEWCTWRWKQEIFLSNHPGIESEFQELSLASVRSRIQAWINNQTRFPPPGAPEEYGFLAQECYPLPESRRLFFQKLVERAQPSTGYKLLALLAQHGTISSVWTTNFDRLVAKAAANFPFTTFEIGLDSAHRTARPQRTGELQCVYLHGDYRYDPLANTEPETQALDSQLRTAFIERIENAPLIVLGYSGRDNSVMSTLSDAYDRPGTGPLYWCSFGDSPPSSNVERLINRAREAGRSAHYVPGAAFDDVMRRLSLSSLNVQARDQAMALIAESEGQKPLKVPFAIQRGQIGAVLRSNAYKVVPPVEAYAFSVSTVPEKGAWAWVRERIAKRPDLVVVPFKQKLWALGSLAAIQAEFGREIVGGISRIPLDGNELGREDGAIVHLTLHALSRALAHSGSLVSEGQLLWDPASEQLRTHNDVQFRIYDAVMLYIRTVDGQSVLALKPTIKVLTEGKLAAERDDEKAIKTAIFGYQHNDKFNAAVEGWRRKLFGADTTFTYPSDDPNGFKFSIDRAPLVAAINAAKGERTIAESKLRSVSQRGIKVSEPLLAFSTKTQVGKVQDAHPIRGLVSNRPFDFALTQTGLAPEVKVGVVCPKLESAIIAKRLGMLHQLAKPQRTEEDYLLNFPGFAAAFGLPLRIPDPASPLWISPREPAVDASPEIGARFAAGAIIAAIDELKASQRFNVAVIITPQRWARWRAFETQSERFNLHDFVKAYCARRGIPTQFIDEDTFQQEQTCRVRWWLSLALYAKSFRTPWVLSTEDDSTAFVGFGTSVDRFGPESQKVVLGCSHIFNGKGQGLQYRLSKIENPVFDSRRRNAFLSKDDARRVGETIRQLSFESRGVLPKRVVIHKRLPFRNEEREGLFEGLQDIEKIDLIEIVVDDSLRYVSSNITESGLQVDRFPVPRGTVIPISEQEALLWVHGSAAALKPGWRYYQGKRRIPAPLLIRRHAGDSDLATVSAEILGLSKMNWNTFDLYTQVPATIETSTQIARIGRLLEGYGEATYDYRLLM